MDGESAGQSTPVLEAAPDDGYFRAGAAGAALTDVASAVDALAAADLSQPGTGGVLDLLVGVEREARRLYGVTIALVGQVEQRGMAAPAGQTSTAALLRQVMYLGKGDADTRVRLAGKVCESTGISGAPVPAVLSRLAAAVQAGTVGARCADSIVQTFNAMPDGTDPELLASVEEFLVQEAATLDPKPGSAVVLSS